MHTDKTILICGASIAGLACAWWLRHHGFDVVVAEKAFGLRDGGQNVDIKGAGQTVIARMGLAERILARNTQERGQRFLDAAGRVIASLPLGGFGCLTSDFEILRGDLAKVLLDATATQGCHVRFGTAVAALEERADGIAVTFDDGRVEPFAMVICAEGIGSTTRRMMLREETAFRFLGAWMAFFRIPSQAGDDGWAHTVNGIGGTFITLRPGHSGETTVLVTFRGDERDPTASGLLDKKALLRHALEGRGNVAERVAAALDAVDDVYFGPMSQVQASTWSKGRFVMLGDAAYCPTPFTGSGCALALVGAYVLAGEIARQSSPTMAFAAYEAAVRPYVEAKQRELSPALIRLLHPRGRMGIAVTHCIEWLIASPPVQALFRPSDPQRARHVASDFTLPEYPGGIANAVPHSERSALAPAHQT